MARNVFIFLVLGQTIRYHVFFWQGGGFSEIRTATYLFVSLDIVSIIYSGKKERKMSNLDVFVFLSIII